MTTTYRTLITPNFAAQERAGNCLPMAQKVVGAGGGPYSATVAANATQHRHWDRDLPTTALAVLWFSHWGTYTDYRNGERRFENWGHVVIWSPDAFGTGRGGFYSSPSWDNGTERPGEWFSSIADIEAVFSSTYQFWSEDLNGVRVCEPVSVPAHGAIIPEEDEVTPEDIEKIAKRTAQLVLTTKIKKYKGGTTSLGRSLKYEDNRFDWLKARVTRLLGKK